MTATTLVIRDATDADTDAICLLNRVDEARLSPMDATRFATLRRDACYCKVAELDGEIAGFLMGFTDNAPYDSVNYRWFDTRMKQFFYVDRVVTDARFRGQGVARRLYEDIQAYARTHDLNWLAAEIDIEPPNTISLAFHKQMGFNEVGTQVYGEGKMVSLQLGPVPPS